MARRPRRNTAGRLVHTALDGRWVTMTDEDRIAWYKAGRAKGLTLRELAAQAETHAKTIQGWMATRGIGMAEAPQIKPDDGPWLRRSVAGRKQGIADAIKAGCRGMTQTAAYLECGTNTLLAFTRNHGILVPPYVAPPAAPRKPRVRKKPEPCARVAPAEPKAPRQVSPPIAPRVYPHRVHMLESRYGQCKFPLWEHGAKPRIADMFYCGAPTDDTVEKTSYCPDCRRIIRRDTHTRAELTEWGQRMAQLRRVQLQQRAKTAVNRPKF